MSEISTKPYLLRAIHEWCTDSGYTPYIAVSVDENTLVPTEFVRAGEIVLNVSMSATNRLSIGNDLIEFQARFGGVARELSIPIDNVSAIYARENGHGMAFEVAKPLAVVEDDEPTLKSVSAQTDDDDQAAEPPEKEPAQPLAAVQEDEALTAESDREPDGEPAESAPPAEAAKKPIRKKASKSRTGNKKSNAKLAAVPKSDPGADGSDDGDDASPSPAKGKSRKKSTKPKLTRVK